MTGVELRPSQVETIFYRPLRVPVSSPNVDAGEFIEREWRHFVMGALLQSAAPWVNSPYANVRASHKTWQLHLARKLGLAVPDTLVTTSAKHLRKFVARKGACVVKPVSYGWFQDSHSNERVMYTRRVVLDDLPQRSDQLLLGSPTLIQEEVSRAFDVRMTVLGRWMQAFAISWDQESDVDWRSAADVSYTPIDVAREIREKVYSLHQSLGIHFGTVDFVVRKGDGAWVFLETNPAGQWGWLDQHVGKGDTPSVGIARALVSLHRSA